LSIATLTESRFVLQSDKLSCDTKGCRNKIGFVRTSSCNYDDVLEIEGYPLNCHQWKCSACSKVLRNQLLDRINLGLQDKSDFYFMTLTSSYRDMNIKSSWHRFHVRMNYKFPIDRFVWLMELTPPSHVYEDWKGDKKVSVGGLRHFHGLISFVDKIPSEEEFKAYWERATKYEANQTHFKKLWDLKSPAGYMAKYLTKSLSSGYHDGERRIGFSQNFPRLKSNLEVKKGVYLPYDPRIEFPEDKEFSKLMDTINKNRYL